MLSDRYARLSIELMLMQIEIGQSIQETMGDTHKAVTKATASNESNTPLMARDIEMSALLHNAIASHTGQQI